MPESRYRIESEKHYDLMDWFLEDTDNLSLGRAECALIVAYMEKKLDDSAFNLGLEIIPVEVTE